jgi:hypothetical protein
MKRWYYQGFASLLTFMGVIGAVIFFLSLKFQMNNEVLIRGISVVFIPFLMVILNLMMNIFMHSRGRFNRKLQSMLYPNLIHFYPLAILFTYIESNDGYLDVPLLKLLGLSTLVVLGFSAVMFIIGFIADRTYHKGWFSIITTIIGLISVISGFIIYQQIIQMMP